MWTEAMPRRVNGMRTISYSPQGSSISGPWRSAGSMEPRRQTKKCCTFTPVVSASSPMCSTVSTKQGTTSVILAPSSSRTSRWSAATTLLSSGSTPPPGVTQYGSTPGLVRLIRTSWSPSSRTARAVRLTTERTVMGEIWPHMFHVKHRRGSPPGDGGPQQPLVGRRDVRQSLRTGPYGDEVGPQGRDGRLQQRDQLAPEQGVLAEVPGQDGQSCARDDARQDGPQVGGDQSGVLGRRRVEDGGPVAPGEGEGLVHVDDGHLGERLGPATPDGTGGEPPGPARSRHQEVLLVAERSGAEQGAARAAGGDRQIVVPGGEPFEDVVRGAEGGAEPDRRPLRPRHPDQSRQDAFRHELGRA